jgi:hypothetical protein
VASKTSNSVEDRGHAVQVAAWLDNLLLRLILTLALEEVPDKLARKLDSFPKRRCFARGEHLICEDAEKALKLVNDVRVVFAHAEEPITFRSRHIEEVAGKDARRAFDDAASRAKQATEERRNRIVYERSLG